MQHSCPKKTLTEFQGIEICYILIDKLALQMNVKHVVTNPYHPQCNGLAKGFYKTLCNMLEETKEYDNKWINYIMPLYLCTKQTCIWAQTSLLLSS